MKLLLLAALASVPCTPPVALTPSQAAIGDAYDAKYGTKELTPDIMVASFTNICGPEMDATERARRELASGKCASRAAVIGVVRGHQALLTPAKKYIFTEVDLEVEEVQRQDPAAPIQVGSTIKVTRAGGAVCTPAGALRVRRGEQDSLETGSRYLLFLTPNGSYYETSDHDWLLTDALAKSAKFQPQEMAISELLGSLAETTCE